MARTAPEVTGTPSLKRVTFRWIDATGDKIAHAFEGVPGDVLVADIEALAVLVGAASNANLYSIEVHDVYYAAPLASSAVDAVERSVYDNFVVLLKGALNATKRFFLPAPEVALFVSGTDNYDSGNTDWDALLAAWVALTPAMTPVSIRYTERREKNEAQAIT